MALSPKVDQMMQMPGADQEQQIFEQSFSDMAQSMLLNKLPDLAQDVATFKVIDSDIDNASAVGAFIVQRPQHTLYIPVVLVENQLKPLEIMYSQEHDAFLPLSPEWLSEIERGTLEDLGKATRTPETLYTDVDIRNLVVPPTTGRYSYASAMDTVADATEKGLNKAKKTALKFPDFLKKTTNKVKKKFASVLAEDRNLLKVAVAIYGHDQLMAALALSSEKTAALETSTEQFTVVTKKTPAQEVKSVFGPHAPEAMKGIATKGFAAKDTRRNLNRPVDEEGQIKLQQVKAKGAYNLYNKDGSTVAAYVSPNPYSYPAEFKYDDHSGPTHARHTRYGVLTADGKFYSVKGDLFGEPVPMNELDGAVAKALKGEAAVKAGKGVFVRNNAGHIEFTEPFEVESVTTGSDGVTRAKARSNWESVTLLINKKAPHNKAFAPKGSGLMVIPADFKWVPAADESDAERSWESPFVNDPARLGASYMNLLKLNGGESVAVKKAGHDDYFISNSDFAGTRVETVVKLASAFRISTQDAESVINIADERGRARVVIASPVAFAKLAEDDKKKKDAPPKKKTTVTEEPAADPNLQAAAAPPPGAPPAEGDPAAMDQAAGMDPNDPAAQGAVDPAAMAPPSPTDQAVAELSEEVQRAHEEQMKLLQHKIDALQMVAQRTQEIVQGVPKEQSPAIQQAVSTAGAGAPQAGSTSPQDPATVAPPGPPDQGGDGPMDPSLMQEAAGLADPAMFDAAAIGTLADHGSLHELVQNYMPTLEKSVDHVGRILLTLWIKGSELREQMGEQNFSNLEDKLRNLFRGIGEVVLRLNRDSLLLAEGESSDSHEAAGV